MLPKVAIKIDEDDYEQYNATIRGFEAYHQREMDKILSKNSLFFWFNISNLQAHRDEFIRLSTVRLWLLRLHVKAVQESLS